MASGVKRRAQDDLEGEQRLAKRFDLLNLGMESTHPYCFRMLHMLTRFPAIRS